MNFTTEQLETIAIACAILRAMAVRQPMGMSEDEIAAVVDEYTEIIELIQPTGKMN